MKIEFDTTNLKKQIEEQPLVAAGIAGALFHGVAKLVTAVAAANNSKTWAKEVKRRTNNSR